MKTSGTSFNRWRLGCPIAEGLQPGAVLGALMTLALYVMLLLGTATVGVPLWWLLLKMAGTGLLGLLAAPVVWAAAGSIERHAGIEPSGDE